MEKQVQDVVGLMQKNLECAICLDLLKNPVSTKCDHHFCRFCIQEFLKTKPSVPCPLCKKPVTKRSLVDRPNLSDIVESVRCLISAFQVDTGQNFSPPRGSQAMHFMPCTPESITCKTSRNSKRKSAEEVKKGTKNVRQSKRRKSEPILPSNINLIEDDEREETIRALREEIEAGTSLAAQVGDFESTGHDDACGSTVGLKGQSSRTKVTGKKQENNKILSNKKRSCTISNYSGDLIDYLATESCGAVDIIQEKLTGDLECRRTRSRSNERKQTESEADGHNISHHEDNVFKDGSLISIGNRVKVLKGRNRETDEGEEMEYHKRSRSGTSDTCVDVVLEETENVCMGEQMTTRNSKELKKSNLSSKNTNCEDECSIQDSGNKPKFDRKIFSTPVHNVSKTYSRRTNSNKIHGWLKTMPEKLDSLSEGQGVAEEDCDRIDNDDDGDDCFGFLDQDKNSEDEDMEKRINQEKPKEKFSDSETRLKDVEIKMDSRSKDTKKMNQHNRLDINHGKESVDHSNDLTNDPEVKRSTDHTVCNDNLTPVPAKRKKIFKSKTKEKSHVSTSVTQCKGKISVTKVTITEDEDIQDLDSKDDDTMLQGSDPFEFKSSQRTPLKSKSKQKKPVKKSVKVNKKPVVDLKLRGQGHNKNKAAGKKIVIDLINEGEDEPLMGRKSNGDKHNKVGDKVISKLNMTSFHQDKISGEKTKKNQGAHKTVRFQDIEKIKEDLHQAEDYDLITCTQEATESVPVEENESVPSSVDMIPDTCEEDAVAIMKPTCLPGILNVRQTGVARETGVSEDKHLSPECVVIESNQNSETGVIADTQNSEQKQKANTLIGAPAKNRTDTQTKSMSKTAVIHKLDKESTCYEVSDYEIDKAEPLLSRDEFSEIDANNDVGNSDSNTVRNRRKKTKSVSMKEGEENSLLIMEGNESSVTSDTKTGSSCVFDSHPHAMHSENPIGSADNDRETRNSGKKRGMRKPASQSSHKSSLDDVKNKTAEETPDLEIISESSQHTRERSLSRKEMGGDNKETAILNTDDCDGDGLEQAVTDYIMNKVMAIASQDSLNTQPPSVEVNFQACAEIKSDCRPNRRIRNRRGRGSQKSLSTQSSGVSKTESPLVVMETQVTDSIGIATSDNISQESVSLLQESTHNKTSASVANGNLTRKYHSNTQSDSSMESSIVCSSVARSVPDNTQESQITQSDDTHRIHRKSRHNKVKNKKLLGQLSGTSTQSMTSKSSVSSLRISGRNLKNSYEEVDSGTKIIPATVGASNDNTPIIQIPEVLPEKFTQNSQLSTTQCENNKRRTRKGKQYLGKDREIADSIIVSDIDSDDVSSKSVQLVKTVQDDSEQVNTSKSGKDRLSQNRKKSSKHRNSGQLQSQTNARNEDISDNSCVDLTKSANGGKSCKQNVSMASKESMESYENIPDTLENRACLRSNRQANEDGGKPLIDNDEDDDLTPPLEDENDDDDDEDDSDLTPPLDDNDDDDLTTLLDDDGDDEVNLADEKKREKSTQDVIGIDNDDDKVVDEPKCADEDEDDLTPTLIPVTKPHSSKKRKQCSPEDIFMMDSETPEKFQEDEEESFSLVQNQEGIIGMDFPSLTSQKTDQLSQNTMLSQQRNQTQTAPNALSQRETQNQSRKVQTTDQQSTTKSKLIDEDFNSESGQLDKVRKINKTECIERRRKHNEREEMGSQSKSQTEHLKRSEREVVKHSNSKDSDTDSDMSQQPKRRSGHRTVRGLATRKRQLNKRISDQEDPVRNSSIEGICNDSRLDYSINSKDNVNNDQNNDADEVMAVSNVNIETEVENSENVDDSKMKQKEETLSLNSKLRKTLKKKSIYQFRNKSSVSPSTGRSSLTNQHDDSEQEKRISCSDQAVGEERRGSFTDTVIPESAPSSAVKDPASSPSRIYPEGGTDEEMCEPYINSEQVVAGRKKTCYSKDTGKVVNPSPNYHDKDTSNETLAEEDPVTHLSSDVFGKIKGLSSGTERMKQLNTAVVAEHIIDSGDEDLFEASSPLPDFSKDGGNTNRDISNPRDFSPQRKMSDEEDFDLDDDDCLVQRRDKYLYDDKKKEEKKALNRSDDDDDEDDVIVRRKRKPVVIEEEDDVIVRRKRKPVVIEEEDDVHEGQGSESEGYSSDDSGTSRQLNLTSSSAFSSQSEPPNTQNQNLLKTDMERMRKEIAAMEKRLAGNVVPESDSNSSKKVKEDNKTKECETNEDNEVIDLAVSQSTVRSTQKSSTRDVESDNDPLTLSPLPPSPPPPGSPNVSVTLELPDDIKKTDTFLNQFRSPVRSESQLCAGKIYDHTGSPRNGKSSSCGKSTPKTETSVRQRKEVFESPLASGTPIRNEWRSPMFENQTLQASSVRTALSPIVSNHSNSEEVSRKSFVATGLIYPQMRELQRLAQQNDCKFYTKFNSSITHVVVKTDPCGSCICERTLKFFQGIAHKCWILDYQWVIDSKKAGFMMPESKYEVVGDSVTGEKHKGPRRSRLSSLPLLEGYQICCVGESEGLTTDSLQELISACGGGIVSDLSDFVSDHLCLVVTCSDLDDEESVSSPEDIRKFNQIYRRYGVVTVSREWVLDSLTVFNVQPLEEYVVTSVKQMKIPTI